MIPGCRTTQEGTTPLLKVFHPCLQVGLTPRLFLLHGFRQPSQSADGVVHRPLRIAVLWTQIIALMG